jgi:hypothetical protein
LQILACGFLIAGEITQAGFFPARLAICFYCSMRVLINERYQRYPVANS